MIIGISGKIQSGKDTIAKIIQYFTETGLTDSITAESFIKNYQMFVATPHFPGWEIKKNAGRLKQVISIMLGIPVEELEKEEIKNKLLPDEWQLFEIYNFGRKTTTFLYTEKEAIDFCNIKNSSQYAPTYRKTERTIRWLMQHIGTNLFRNGIHRDIHINMLYNNYIPSVSKWLVTDVRFPNELHKIEEFNGFTIRVNRNVYYWKDKERKFVTTTPFIEEYEGLESDTYSKNHPSEIKLDNYEGFKYTIDNNGTLAELIEHVKEICIKEKLI